MAIYIPRHHVCILLMRYRTKEPPEKGEGCMRELMEAHFLR